MSDSNPVDQNVDQNQPAQQPAEPKVEPTDPNSLFSDQLASIQAPDGRQKYADVQTALSSIQPAQEHISTQAQRIKELEAELAKKQGVEEVLEQLKSQQQPVETPSNVGIDETAINHMLDQRLQQRDIEAVQNANASQVLNKLNETFGDKAEVEFNQKAVSLGMTPAQLSDLARTSPQAALAFFETKPQSPANPTTGSINTNVLDSQPQQQPHPNMAIFNGGTSPNVKSWRDAAIKPND